jgi:Salmonella virulence plasmid 65kDa B protein
MTKHIAPPKMTSARRAIALAVALALFIPAGDSARAEAPAPPGGYSGTFATSIEAGADGASGAMVYTIPFTLPAARGDAQPSLGLSYRSGRGTAEAGESWSLGMPAIERAPLSTFPRYVDNGLPAMKTATRTEGSRSPSFAPSAVVRTTSARQASR